MEHRLSSVGIAAALIVVAGGLCVQYQRASHDSRKVDSSKSATGRSPGQSSAVGEPSSRRGKLTALGGLTGQEARRVWTPGSYEYNLLSDVLEPFDPEQLTELLAQPDSARRRLADLIHRAAAEKDIRFRYMLEMEELRSEQAFDLAVAAYDFAVNGTEESLDHILRTHAEQEPGSDSSSIVTLSYLDEWGRTISAYRRHFAGGTDGTGGDAKYAFMLRREYLFPQNFRRFQQREAEQGTGDQSAADGSMAP